MLCAILLLLMAAPALAVEGEDFGFYNIGSAENVQIVPVSASMAVVSAVSQNVDGIDDDERFYPGSCALRVTLSRTEQGKEYILTVSAEESVYYVDQQTGGGAITFQVAFVLPTERTDMTLSIGSDATDFSRLAIPLSYTPGLARKPDDSVPYDRCARDGDCVLHSFEDLDAQTWYHDGVHYVLDEGLMYGYGNGSFGPSDNTSRAMIVTMLWRLEGSPLAQDPLTFADVGEDIWYTEAIRWAASQGIVTGYNAQTFGPNDTVRREQLVAILWRYAGYKGIDVEAGVTDHLGNFLDTEQISSWALEAMRWAVDAQLLHGLSSEKLGPQANVSRAQVATMLMRYCTAIAA